MFETFDAPRDVRAAGRFAVSTAGALAVLGLVALAAAAFTAVPQAVIDKVKKVEVVFHPAPVPPPAPAREAPPPPPPVRSAPGPVARVRPSPGVAPAALFAPKALPQERPPEAEPAQAVAAAPISVGGTGRLAPGAEAAAPGSGGGGSSPINLPENAVPPRELSTNAPPEYPSEARARGLEGLVILKIVIEADGQVSQVQPLKGDEPFLSAAIGVVRRWRYQPAQVEGQPISVFRIVKLPFRLKS